MPNMRKTAQEIFNIIELHRDAIKRFGVRQLGLFGSQVRGESTEQSDLDFLVELEHHTFDAYMNLKEFIEELFACPVDLVLVDAIKPRLRETILRETLYVPGF